MYCTSSILFVFCDLSRGDTNISLSSHLFEIFRPNFCFLPHSSLKESQSKLTKSREDLFFSCRYIYVYRQNALGESPRTHVSPNPPSSPAPQNSFYSFPPKRKDEKGENGDGGE